MSTLVTTNIQHGGAASPNMVLTSDGDVTFGGDVTLGTSVLAAPTGNAPSYTCRAWVNFDGTGTFSPNPSTTKIRASGNVSSIFDNGTGDYTVNFTTAMPDANYAANVTAGSESTDVRFASGANEAPTTTTCRFSVRNLGTGNNTDASYVLVSIFR